MDSKNNTHISIPIKVKERLLLIKHPHQSLGGVIEELLNLTNSPKPPEEKPIDPLAAIKASVLNHEMEE